MLLSEQHQPVVGSRLLPIPGPEGAPREKVRAYDAIEWVGLCSGDTIPGGIFGITEGGPSADPASRGTSLRSHVKRCGTHVAEAERDFGEIRTQAEESPREVSSYLINFRY